MRATPNPQTTQFVFLGTMCDETVQLLADAHEYFNTFGPEDQQTASAVEKLVYSSEMSRITLRLSSVMAWLMARRAESAGKITRAEAAKSFRLAFADICMKDLPEMHGVLPEAMCELLERSLELYRRAARLDEMLVEEVQATLH